jgi:hypothetical protein
VEELPLGPLGLAVIGTVALLGVVAGLRRVLRKPAHELTPVDRIVVAMLLGRFYAPLRARFQAASPEGKPLPHLTCPACGGPNECAPAKQGSFGAECWCTRVKIGPEALAAVPVELAGKACLCPRCATEPASSRR